MAATPGKAQERLNSARPTERQLKEPGDPSQNPNKSPEQMRRNIVLMFSEDMLLGFRVLSATSKPWEMPGVKQSRFFERKIMKKEREGDKRPNERD